MEKFDTIIVGAGLAGLASAYSLAKDGLNVLVIERGTYPGAKNMTGGRIYMNAIRNMAPELWKDAPFERYVTKEILTFTKKDCAVSFELTSEKFKKIPYHSYTILSAKFDKWLASKVEEAGATIITKMKVDNLLVENSKVTGVLAADDKVKADVVVLAEGANSQLALKLRLRKELSPEHYAIGIKEVIELPRKVIEERFGLENEEGIAQLFVGSITQSLRGGGFLYTNLESLSLGIVLGIPDAMAAELQVHEFLDKFKAHPAIFKLVKDGKSVEYSAHIIPEGGLCSLSEFYRDGLLVVGDAAGFSLNMGIAVRGMDYAIASGFFAAETIKKAKEKNDFSRNILSNYEHKLNESFVMKDFKTFKNAPEFLSGSRVYELYPELICNIFEEIMYIGDKPKKRISKVIKDEALKQKSILRLIANLMEAYRAL